VGVPMILSGSLCVQVGLEVANLDVLRSGPKGFHVIIDKLDLGERNSPKGEPFLWCGQYGAKRDILNECVGNSPSPLFRRRVPVCGKTFDPGKGGWWVSVISKRAVNDELE
jgi:hypothetical protein